MAEGAGRPIVEDTATIRNRTADGVYVAVTRGYSYNAAPGDRTTVHADVISEALYPVTENESRRVRGTDVAPC